jgi:hypothetical protein
LISTGLELEGEIKPVETIKVLKVLKKCVLQIFSMSTANENN